LQTDGQLDGWSLIAGGGLDWCQTRGGFALMIKEKGNGRTRRNNRTEYSTSYKTNNLFSPFGKNVPPLQNEGRILMNLF
jgi:hypothetical protein